MSFIDSLLATPQFSLLVRVPESFIDAHQNDKDIRCLTKFPTQVFDLLVNNKKDTNSQVKSDAGKVYGAIHALYLETDDGREKLLQKYQQNGTFQTCPRLFCNHCKCLPYGTTSKPEEITLKWFCPYCSDLYNPSDLEL